MRKIYIGTGWKMNKTLVQGVDYIQHLKENTPDNARMQVFVVAPFTHLWALRELSRGSSLMLGAQNMHWEASGAYTGEISPPMLAEIGVDLVELGHSERRLDFGETDFTVNKKVLASQVHGLLPLVCVGETAQEKAYGVMQEVISRQIKIALHGLKPRDCAHVWIAYEPVWAIGSSGAPADPGYASQAHHFIRSVLAELFGEQASENVPLLYGGSVNNHNALEYLRQPGVDGLFIGRAAWDVVSFLDILDQVSAFLATID